MLQSLLGLIGVVLGVLALKNVGFLHEMTGQIRWAEKGLGSGGTITALRLFALFVIVISALYMLHML